MWSKTKLIIYTLVLSFLIAVPANADIFMRIDGVDGESNDPNHPRWIDVLYAGGNFTTNSCGEFVVAKELDRAFPILVQSVVSGSVFSTIILEYTAVFGGSRATPYVITLDNAWITKISTDLQGDDSGRPVEVLLIRSSSITVQYTVYDPEGNKGETKIETVICGKAK